MSILLLSHQRCGSSALTRFMGKACGVSAAMEPFNKRVLTKTFPTWETASREELADHFGAGLRAKRVTKHIYGQHEAEIDQLLIEHPGAETLVLLWREDVHAAALSSVIARATGTYQRRPEEEGPIGRIPPKRVRKVAAEMRSAYEQARAQAEASGKPLKSVSYESIYQDVEQDRRRALREVLDFVGLAHSPEFDSAFEEYMSQDSKINSISTYQRIANYDELREQFPRSLAAE